ncbi:cell division protein FtsQ [Silvibacterium bohemicum]|uniref:Cell division protein FtsQ n=1 Tax=Silvibacterium bohemicum TaxID=1577686 RepID=A0A841JR78_9BACT|nr:cell division protein FtsQ [Silvibacterium bohemicum]
MRPAQPSAAPSSRARASRNAERDASRGQASDRLLDKAAEGLGQRIEDDEPFLRTRRRVPVKKGLLPLWTKTRWGRIALAGAAIAVLAGGVALVFSVKSFFDHDPCFRIDTASSIQTVGNSQLSRTDLLSVFGSDIGRNLFYVPLVQRRAELEQIPWVQHATVMRLLPNELRVAVTERTPIAFVRVADQVKLVDAEGVILDMPPAMMAAKHFSFPVVTGIHPGDLLSARKPRMQMYQKFLAELDASGEKLSEQMSEIDLSDPEDVRATVPAKSTDLLLHFGEQNFLARYRVYQSHLSEWEQQYPRLAAVDLRYDGQVVLKMADGKTGDGKTADTSNTSPAPAKADAPVAKPASKPATMAAAKSIAAKKHAARQRREAQR